MRIRGWVVIAAIGCSGQGIIDVANVDGSGSGADADLADGGRLDAATDAPPTDAATSNAPTRYVTTARHSPYAPSVVANLKAVLAGGNRGQRALSKIGASNTVNTGFLSCFAGSDLKLEGYASLEPTRAWFAAPLPSGGSAYSRVSLAATVGWRAVHVVSGSPNAAEEEIAATNAAFALITLGSNDSFEGGLDSFDANLRKLLDQLLSAHVVPILSTIPTRKDSVSADQLAREINALIWLAGETHQIPVINVYDALVPLGDGALVSDGIHLSVYSSGGSKGCWFTAEGLKKGHNVRNLLTLEGLDRAKRYLLDGQDPEPSIAKLSGAGSLADPIVVSGFPFAAEGNTKSAPAQVDGYSCGTQKEDGGEVVYRFSVSKRGTYRMRVIDDDGVDVDLYLLRAADPKACVARHDRLLEETLEAGDYWLVVDTFGGVNNAGKYRLSGVAL